MARRFGRSRPSPAPKLELLDDRITPTVRVFDTTGAQVGPAFDGASALQDAVAAATTLDGFTVRADTTNAPADGYLAPIVTKSLTILGPNADINPVTGATPRVAEVRINTDRFQAGNADGYISVTAGRTVEIRGFTFASDASGAGAVRNPGNATYNLTFRNNIVSNQQQSDAAAVQLGGNGTQVVSDNLFRNMDFGRRVMLVQGGGTATVSGNAIVSTIAGFPSGLTGVEVRPSAGAIVTITNNFLGDTADAGIFVTDRPAGSTVNLTFNTLSSNNQNADATGGALILAGVSNAANAGRVNITNNLAVGGLNGLTVLDGAFPTAADAVFVTRNNFSGAGGSPYLLGGTGATINLSGDFFGTVNNIAPTAAGYPAALNSAAILAGAQPRVIASYLSAGTNLRTTAGTATAGSYGFDPNPTGPNAVEMIVPAPGSVSGLNVVAGVIQTGVDRTTAPLAVRVRPAAFNENVTVGADRILISEGATISPAAGAPLTITAGTTTLRGTFTTTGGSAVAAGATVTGAGGVTGPLANAGTVAPGEGGPGTFFTGDYTQTGALAIQLTGNTPGTGYDQLSVTGTVALGGALNVIPGTGFVPAFTDSFTLIANDGSDAVTGTFAGLPEGAIVSLGSGADLRRFRITYVGGDGNDVVLAAAPATLNAIPDPTPVSTGTGRTVNLTGIGPGTGDPAGLQVTAVSSNPSLVPNPQVTYTAPNATGTLNFTSVAGQTGTADITVTVTAPGAAPATRTFRVTVNANAPVAITFNGANGTGPTGSPTAVPFQVAGGSGTFPTVTYSVSGPNGFTATGTGSPAQFTPPTAGAYTITVNATDSVGATGTGTFNFTAVNTPAITFTGASGTGPVNRTTSVPFQATGGTGAITTSYTVTDAAGTQIATGTGSPATFVPPTPGVYTVRVTGTDAAGVSGTGTFNFTAIGAPTVSFAGAPSSGLINAVASVPFTTAGGIGAVSTTFTVTDASGAVVASGVGSPAAFTPAAGGVFTVRVTATDAEGQVGTGTFAFTALAAGAPAISFDGANGTGPVNVPASVPFTVTGGAGAVTTTFTVTGPDGAVIARGTGSPANFRPTRLGTHTITVVSTDAAGQRGTATFLFTATAPAAILATGAGQDPADSTTIKWYDATTRRLLFTAAPFEGSFLGDASVATGDYTGDGFPDVAVGAGNGGGPRVVVYDGRTGVRVANFFAYDPAMRGGVYVALADLDGDGRAEVITGAGKDGAPHVKVFENGSLQEIRSFYAYDPIFRGGVTVATGLITADATPDIITGAGPGGAPHVKVFDGTDFTEVLSYFAYAQSFLGGINVGAMGTVGGLDRIVTGADVTGSRHVRVWSAAGQEQDSRYVIDDPAFHNGVRVGGVDWNRDGIDDLVVGGGPGDGPRVQILDGVTFDLLDNFFSGDVDSRTGVYVG